VESGAQGFVPASRAHGMVAFRDEGGEFPGPLEAVWAFVGSGDTHSGAHHLANVERERLSERQGQYSWTQRFRGAPTRFGMRWSSFYPLGLAYEVLEGPFLGSVFFLFYEAKGPRTAVSIAGDFRSPSLPERDLLSAVKEFFDQEFEDDTAGLIEWASRRP